MRVIKPVTLGESQLISSTVAETEYATYAAGTNYAVGARCIDQHVIYESVQTPNAGNPPATSPLYWANIAPTNKWAMFDREISTQTSDAGLITVVIKPGYINSLAVFGLEGETLEITGRAGLAGPIIYSASRTLDGTVLADWYQYFYEPYVQLGEVILPNLPTYGEAHITITVTGAGAVKCGMVVAGTVYQIGDTQYGASAGIIDYSRKDTSPSGVTSLTKRKFSKRMSAPLMLDNAQINKVQRLLADLRATPCAWIGVDAAGFEPLIIFGFYRDFSIDVAYPTVSYCNLEIEGLI